ncbi:MAG: ribonuclease III [Bernardetiaceae bacterium]|nr:ribonuclease III [Bernardetiaceae bacterium]
MTAQLVFILRYCLSFFKRYTKPEDKALFIAVRQILGARPLNLQVYELAMRHASIAKKNQFGFRECNERLEYLGDAVLGTVVADFLFKKYPYKNEGFLTSVRSRIVSRDSLNDLAKQIGLEEILAYDKNRRNGPLAKAMYGDAMEAFIGAVYLDRGYNFCQKFIIKKLLLRHFDIDEVVANDSNYKSKLIEWAQKFNHDLEFNIQKQEEGNNKYEFCVQLRINGDTVSSGNGLSKKKAQQDAARRACETLNIE